MEGMQQLLALISHMDHSLNSDRGLFPLMWGKIYREAVPPQPCLGQIYFIYFNSHWPLQQFLWCIFYKPMTLRKDIIKTKLQDFNNYIPAAIKTHCLPLIILSKNVKLECSFTSSRPVRSQSLCVQQDDSFSHTSNFSGMSNLWYISHVYAFLFSYWHLDILLKYWW